MENNKNNPSVWFVCKFCRRAFQQPRELVRHKRAVHLELFLADVERKKLERKGDGAATEPRGNASAGAREDRRQNNDLTRRFTRCKNHGTSPSTQTEPMALDSVGLETVGDQGYGTVLCRSDIINNDDSDRDEQDDSSSDIEESHDPKNKSTTCPICSKTFTCDRSYQLHKKFRHTVDRPFPCNYCYLTFKHPRVRHHHIFKFHMKQRQSKSNVSNKPLKRDTKETASQPSKSVVIKATNQKSNNRRGQQQSSNNDEMDDYQSTFGDARASTARKRSLRSTRNGNSNNCGKYATKGSVKSKFTTARMRPSMPRNDRRILRY